MDPEIPVTADLVVACLGAGWCHVCDEYRVAFAAAQSSLGPGPRWLWIDIEDREDIVGELDVEDFPTLLIARGGVVLFFGTVQPQPQHLLRLVRAASAGELAAAADLRVQSAAQRLARLRSDRPD